MKSYTALINLLLHKIKFVYIVQLLEATKLNSYQGCTTKSDFSSHFIPQNSPLLHDINEIILIK